MRLNQKDTWLNTPHEIIYSHVFLIEPRQYLSLFHFYPSISSLSDLQKIFTKWIIDADTDNIDIIMYDMSVLARAGYAS